MLHGLSTLSEEFHFKDLHTPYPWPRVEILPAEVTVHVSETEVGPVFPTFHVLCFKAPSLLLTQTLLYYLVIGASLRLLHSLFPLLQVISGWPCMQRGSSFEKKPQHSYEVLALMVGKTVEIVRYQGSFASYSMTKSKFEDSGLYTIDLHRPVRDLSTRP